MKQMIEKRIDHMSEVKPILRFEEMEDYFNRKGITYNRSKDDLIRFLSETNYFYKLISYRKNFPKYKNQDKYMHLSFETLSDMATIDMHLRYLVLKMCLDIEHRLKTLILAEITSDESEDGYSIVDDFINTSNDPDEIKEELLVSAKTSRYNKALYDKYKDKPPIWVIFETISFGKFIDFVRFYIKRNPNTQYKYLYNLLYSIRNIRNIAAHSSPLLIDITEDKQIKPSQKITNYLFNEKGIGKTTGRKKISNMRIYDLTTLYFVYDRLIPNGGMKKARKKEIIKFLQRTRREEELYEKQRQITSIFVFFAKLCIGKPKNKT
jgi:Abi-like protein